MNSSLLQKYLGEPVVVQLKLPLVGIVVKTQESAPHFKTPSVPAWVPMAAAGPQGAPEATQLLQGAVISEIDEAMGTCEIQWLAISPSPRSVVATLMDLDNIAAVTRVVSVAPPPEPSRIITG